MGLEADMWHDTNVDGVAVQHPSEFSEFISAEQSMVDGLGQTCGLLSASVPTQVESTGYTSWILEILTPGQLWCNGWGSKREREWWVGPYRLALKIQRRVVAVGIKEWQQN